MNIWAVPQNELDAVTLFQEYGIIPTEKLCENGHQMNFCVGERVFWQCHTKPCKNKRISAREGSRNFLSKFWYL
jgi:hypothetical protein